MIDLFEEWDAQQRHSGNMFHLNMTPEEQAVYRKRIIEGCIGIGDCWIWNGAKTEDGYGNIRVGNSTRIVSRLAKCLATDASLSVAQDACHIVGCPSRACCNPNHLDWGDHDTNNRMKEPRDVRWTRYINAMQPNAKGVFVVFEKRYIPNWGWLDCRTVQPVGQGKRTLHAVPHMLCQTPC